MTHYQTLGVKRTATTEEIGAAFRRKAKRCHPDVSTAPDAAEQFKRINEAHQVLSNPEKRREYDASLNPPKKDKGIVDALLEDERVQEALSKTASAIFDHFIRKGR